MMLLVSLMMLGLGLWLFLGPLLNKDGFRKLYSRGSRFNLYPLFKNPEEARLAYIIIGMLIICFALWMIKQLYFPSPPEPYNSLDYYLHSE